MERRFKTSNHSNEQAKRISIEASSIDKKKSGKRGRREDRMREKKMGPERRGTQVRFLSTFNRDSEDADDYDSSREIPLPRFRLFDENIQEILR